MNGFILMVGQSIKSYLGKIQTWILLLQLVTIVLVTYVYLDLSNENYHYYMNTKTSIEEIHKVKIDKYNGKLEKELTTEDELIRKQSRKWHLKYMFK